MGNDNPTINNNYAKGTPYKTESKFFNLDDIDGIRSDINFQKLIDDINTFYNEKRVIPFNALQDYIGKEIRYQGNTDMTYTIDKEIELMVDNNPIKIKGILNKDIKVVDFGQLPLFKFHLDANNKEIRFIIYYPFQDLSDIAIVLETNNYVHFEALLKYIHKILNKNHPDSSIKIINDFNLEFIKARKSNGYLTLDWLYENAPDFVLEQIDDWDLYDDLILLLKYDKRKWFVDTSNAMLRILLSFKNLEYLYFSFYGEPTIVIQLYKEMDKGNQDQFCQFLTVLSLLNTNPEQLNDIGTINYGKNYSLESELFFDVPEDKAHIVVYRNDIRWNEPSADGQSAFVNTVKETDEHYHPLDLVWYVNADTGIKQPVCALFIKSLSDKKEKELVQEVIFGAITIISMFFAVGILARGAVGMARALAIIDLITGSIDIGLMNDDIKRKLEKVGPEGKWFVDNWSAISAVIGTGVLTKELAEGVIKNGPKVYKFLVNTLRDPSLGAKIENLMAKARLINRLTDDVGDGSKFLDETVDAANDATKVVDELFDVEKALNKLGLRKYFNRTTLDLLDKSGKLVFRLDVDDLESFLKFQMLPKSTKRTRIMTATQELRINSKAKYNPLNAKKKGFRIPKSKNGIAPDFSKTLQHLYNASEASIVKITITGSRDHDFIRAFEKIGIYDKETMKEISKKYVWHHMDDLDENLDCTMQLVLKDVHTATFTHIGSCEQSRKSIGLLGKYKK